MVSLQKYIYDDWLYSSLNEDAVNHQIQPNLTTHIVTYPNDYANNYVNKQCVTSSKDKIWFEFDYYKDKFNEFIKPKDVTIDDDKQRWFIYIKSKYHMNIKYKLSGQYTETGYYGISTIDANVDVYINGNKDSSLTPKVYIESEEI